MDTNLAERHNVGPSGTAANLQSGRASPAAKPAEVVDLPGALPGVGHLLEYLPDKLGFLRRAARHGRVVRMQLGSPTYLLTAPEDIRHVLEGRPEVYEKTLRLTGPLGKSLSGEGLLTSDYADARRLRRPLQPLFHQQVLGRFADTIVRFTDEAMAAWPDGGMVDVTAEMLRLAHRVIGYAVFSADFASQEDGPLGYALDLRRRYLQYRILYPLPFADRLPLPFVRRYPAIEQQVEREVGRRIDERTETADLPPDWLSLLVQATDADGGHLSRKRILDEVLTLVTTGYETIADLLTWSWWLLARHTDAYERVLAEIQENVGDRPPTADDVPRLRYTGMVLAEALRLYPPTWIFVRIASQPDRLPSGAEIPTDAKVYLCPWVVHRDPRLFPEPDRFDPDRFTPDERQRRPRFAYFPFGGGLRTCLGQPLALMQATLVLARLVQCCAWRVDARTRAVPHPGLTLHPRDRLQARVYHR